MAERALLDDLWYGESAGARAGRALAAPASKLFGAVVGARDLMYEAGWLRTHATPIPVVSVGNLTVGGTGKTPIAAWVARELAARGAHPAVVLRGYGDDEPLVHSAVNPSIPVVTAADRVAGVDRAAGLGASIAVLDDAFQHRRVRRAADLVLVSADRWTPSVRLLPAGPWREPLSAARRATLVIVTRKAASEAAVDAVNEAVARAAPSVPRVTVRLALGELVRTDAADVASETRPIASLAGARVHAVLAIADPRAFVRQLEAIGASVRTSVFLDHHAFTDAESARIARSIGDGEWAVCTLKDAVKLAPRWPRLAPPLWYVSQRVTVERGVGGLERMLDDLVRPRPAATTTSGTAG
ncbi:MAG TPA: tetraacyldisaccharide 4'-kinase [Gemmatimonadaceae bacterium]|nr:tetraacyldisaccharide 4'-kinase [Gemmatimonadaceae bacterium]